MYESEFVLIISLVLSSHPTWVTIRNMYGNTTVHLLNTDIVLHRQTDAEGGHCGIPDKKRPTKDF